MEDSVVIKVENLTKIYKLYEKPIDRLKEAIHPLKQKYHKNFHALKDISFEVKKGDCLGIIGKNGSGKSTLLKIITGVLTPTLGKVTLGGKVAALLELGAGFNPEFTGLENIYLQGSISGFSREYMDKIVPEIIEFADIGDFINQPVKMYSSGMFIRLAFAVSSCTKPDILIVDEALSVGDFFFVQKCYKKIEEIIKQGTTVVFVTHNISDLIKFCNKAILLENGKCIYQGDSLIAMQKYLATPMPQDSNLSDTSFKNTNVDNWIPEGCALDISRAHIETNGDAVCTKVGISNVDLKPANFLKVGDTIIFYIEFKAVKDMDVPICGVSIFDKHGNVVHGKHSLHYEAFGVKQAKKNDLIRCKLKIKLDIALGEYSYVIGLSAMEDSYYKNIKVLSNNEVLQNIKRITHLSKINTFLVYGNEMGFPVNFNGMCNLNGGCEIEVL
jgi:lipopolysaccharide transport system ATP-binding protein